MGWRGFASLFGIGDDDTNKSPVIAAPESAALIPTAVSTETAILYMAAGALVLYLGSKLLKG